LLQLLIDNSFKEAIAKAFYDKEISVYEIETVQDYDGSTRREISESEDSILGNVRFNELTRVQESYGISEKIDVVISTQESVANGVVLGYGGKLFEVIKVLPFDSHNLVIGKQCRSEYSTLIEQLSA
jgi:hypothetical protein